MVIHELNAPDACPSRTDFIYLLQRYIYFLRRSMKELGLGSGLSRDSGSANAHIPTVSTGSFGIVMFSTFAKRNGGSSTVEIAALCPRLGAFIASSIFRHRYTTAG